jgi:voltage-dependent calcium channel L type alpha-1D
MRPPYSEWSQPFFYIAESIYLQSFIMICIVINTIILSMSWYGQPDHYNTTFDNLNLVFTVIFTLEFLIKAAGYGSRLFTDSWNTFDMIVVLISILGIIMSAKEDSQIGP